MLILSTLYEENVTWEVGCSQSRFCQSVLPQCLERIVFINAQYILLCFFLTPNKLPIVKYGTLLAELAPCMNLFF